eukprot:COSAG06_NODE_398_length_16243_cov_3.649839_21_plen_84_part_01
MIGATSSSDIASCGRGPRARRPLAVRATAGRRGGWHLTINSVFINQAPWYIEQRVKTVTELARHSSENTLSLSPRPTKTGRGII